MAKLKLRCRSTPAPTTITQSPPSVEILGDLRPLINDPNESRLADDQIVSASMPTTEVGFREPGVTERWVTVESRATGDRYFFRRRPVALPREAPRRA